MRPMTAIERDAGLLVEWCRSRSGAYVSLCPGRVRRVVESAAAFVLVRIRATALSRAAPQARSKVDDSGSTSGLSAWVARFVRVDLWCLPLGLDELSNEKLARTA